ncbi:barstar family protein [Rhodococcus sp. NPDC054953]
MTTLHQFVTAQPPIVGLLPGAPRDADNAAYALTESGYAVRLVRGPKMPTVAAVFDEVAAALQFPYYFGGNRDAFDECLRDWRDWLGDAPELVVVVRDADALLGEEPQEIGWLLSAFADASIRVVAQAGPTRSAAVTRRWAAAGAPVQRIDD